MNISIDGLDRVHVRLGTGNIDHGYDLVAVVFVKRDSTSVVVVVVVLRAVCYVSQLVVVQWSMHVVAPGTLSLCAWLWLDSLIVALKRRLVRIVGRRAGHVVGIVAALDVNGRLHVAVVRAEREIGTVVEPRLGLGARLNGDGNGRRFHVLIERVLRS